MTDHVGLRRTLALVLNGSLMCALGAGFAADMGNMVNPSQWMGGNSRGSPGYGYDGPFGPDGPATYRPQSGRASAGYASSGSHAPTFVPPAPVPYPDLAARLSDLERRMGDLEADERRQKTLLSPLRPSESGYGPRAP